MTQWKVERLWSGCARLGGAKLQIGYSDKGTNSTGVKVKESPAVCSRVGLLAVLPARPVPL